MQNYSKCQNCENFIQHYVFRNDIPRATNCGFCKLKNHLCERDDVCNCYLIKRSKKEKDFVEVFWLLSNFNKRLQVMIKTLEELENEKLRQL